MGRHVPPLAWFESAFDRDKCLVLLDGFDEVADQEERRRVAKWIECQMRAHGGNRFVITSRPHGYRTTPLSGVTVLEVQPFNAEQMRRFVENWYFANEVVAHGGWEDEGVRLAARKGAADLLARLGSGAHTAIADLAVNPLLLTMIATVHRFRSSLPGRRVELYAEICEVFLGKRKQDAGLEDTLTPAKRQRVLEVLAYEMMINKARDLPVENAARIIATVTTRVGWNDTDAAFLKHIEERSGLLLEREIGKVAFAHLAFQEYLAATHIANDASQGLADIVPTRINDSWWHETVRLYCAQADASAVVEACLARDPPDIGALMLAQDIEEEARELDPNLREKIRGAVDEGLESGDPDRFRIAAEVLLRRRLNSLTRIDENRAIDPTLITHAEYQLFIDEMKSKQKFRHPDHWLTMRFAPGSACDPVLGVRGRDGVEFCEWLSKRGGGLWRYRLPTEMEIATSPEGEEEMINGVDLPVSYWVSSKIDDNYHLSHFPDRRGCQQLGLKQENQHLEELMKHALNGHGDDGCTGDFHTVDLTDYYSKFIREMLNNEGARNLHIVSAIHRDRPPELSVDLSGALRRVLVPFRAITANIARHEHNSRAFERFFRQMLPFRVAKHIAHLFGICLSPSTFLFHRYIGQAIHLSRNPLIQLNRFSDISNAFIGYRKVRADGGTDAFVAPEDLSADIAHGENISIIASLLLSRAVIPIALIANNSLVSPKSMLDFCCRFFILYFGAIHASFEVGRFLRRIRIILAALALFDFSSSISRSRWRYLLHRVPEAESAIANIIATLYNIQERLHGRQRPFEGIRIVRERVDVDQGAKKH